MIITIMMMMMIIMMIKMFMINELKDPGLFAFLVL